MGIEIERKFLVKKEAWDRVKKESTLYQQGYLLRDDDKTIRIRVVKGKGGFITVKGKTEGCSRLEYEYQIPESEAVEMLTNFCDSVVTKNRFLIEVNKKVWEVDEFLEDNAGLVLAEIELQHQAETFELPEWIGEEVTDDKRYYNSQLSVNSYKNWKL